MGYKLPWCVRMMKPQNIGFNHFRNMHVQPSSDARWLPGASNCCLKHGKPIQVILLLQNGQDSSQNVLLTSNWSLRGLKLIKHTHYADYTIKYTVNM